MVTKSKKTPAPSAAKAPLAAAKKTLAVKDKKAPKAARRSTAVEKAAALEKAAKKATAKGRKGASKVVHMTHDAAFKLLDSQRAIWLAGLGALAKANATAGTKGEQAFEALVSMGASFEASARGAIDNGTERLKNGVDDATTALDQGIDNVGLSLDTLVEQALDRLGFPKSDAFNQLFERLTDLSKALEAKVRGNLPGNHS